MPAFLLSAIGPIVSGVFSAAGSVMSTIGSVLRTAAHLVMSAVQTIAQGLMAVGGLVVKGVMMFADVLMKVTQAAMAYAKSVNDFRLQTGQGMGGAAATAMRFVGFGITPEMLAAARGGQHESIYRMRGARYGVDPNDPASIARRAQSYGNTITGHAMRKALLDGIEMNTPQGRWMASLSQKQIADQEAFTSRIGQSLGVSPETMSRMAEALPLAQAKLATFLQMVQLKFVEGALPMMEKGIAWISDFIGTHSAQIASTFQSVFEWIFVDGPDVAIKGARWVVGAFKWLSDGFFGVAHTVVAFLRTLESADSGLGGFVVGFLNAVDNTINTFQFLSDTWHNFLGTIANSMIIKIRVIASIIQGALAAAGMGNSKWARAVGEFAKMELVPWRSTHADQQSSLAADFQKKQKTGDIGRWADNALKNLDTYQGYADDKFAMISGAIDNVANAVGTKDERAATYREMLGELRGINKHTADTARGIKGGPAGGGLNEWMARFAVERAKDRYLQETR